MTSTSFVVQVDYRFPVSNGWSIFYSRRNFTRRSLSLQQHYKVRSAALIHQVKPWGTNQGVDAFPYWSCLFPWLLKIFSVSVSILYPIPSHGRGEANFKYKISEPTWYCTDKLHDFSLPLQEKIDFPPPSDIFNRSDSGWGLEGYGGGGEWGVNQF